MANWCNLNKFNPRLYRQNDFNKVGNACKGLLRALPFHRKNVDLGPKSQNWGCGASPSKLVVDSIQIVRNSIVQLYTRVSLLRVVLLR